MARLRSAVRLHQHVLGHGQDHGALAALPGRGEGAPHQLGRSGGLVDLGRPLGEGAEHLAVVHLLEGAAALMLSRDLTDHQQHRGGILIGGVHCDRGVHRARPAGDHADARPAGELAVGFGHVGGVGLVAAGDHPDPVGDIGQGVENREITLARHTEDVIDAVGDQGVDDPAGDGGLGGHGGGHSIVLGDHVSRGA